MSEELDRGPGPEERKLRNRLRFKLTGRWGPAVVHERMTTPVYIGDTVHPIIHEQYETAGQPCPYCAGEQSLWVMP